MSEMETSTPIVPPPPLVHTGPRWPEIVIAAGVLLTICYVAELVFVVLLISILAAFILAPVVDFLIDFHLPRSLASLVAVALLLLVVYGATYASYNQVVNFLHLLPKYSSRIREEVMTFRKQAESLNPLTPSDDDKNALTIRPPSPLNDLLTRGFDSVGHAIISFSFAPFLIYFMLSWQQHVRSATVMLFSMEHRHTAYRTLGLISLMIRGYVVSNLLVGLFMVIVSIAIFGLYGLPFLCGGRSAKRIPEPGSLYGSVPGADPAGYCSPGPNPFGRPDLPKRRGLLPARVRAQRDVSEADREKPALESAGGHDWSSFLGMGLGRDGSGARDSRSLAPPRSSSITSKRYAHGVPGLASKPLYLLGLKMFRKELSFEF